MKNIPFHIAYLLSRYECVVVPGFGAFVVSSSNREETSQNGILSLSPPKNSLGFNPEIRHDDGLLANSIAKEKNISYIEANRLIAQYVIRISRLLNDGKKVKIPRVGTLYSHDRERLFHPEKILSCNASYYGLTDFSLPYLEDLRKRASIFTKKREEEIVWIPVNRKFISYAGSIAAALIATCIIPTPLNDPVSPGPTQYASLISLSTSKSVDEEIDVSDRDIQIPADSFSLQSEIETLPSEATDDLAETTASYYYVIIASLPDQSIAKEILAKYRSKGLKNAAILFSDGKYRVYANRFEDNSEAERFLIRFRKDYPMFRNAWLLTQKISTQSEDPNEI